MHISSFSAKKLVCQEIWNTFDSDHFASTFELVSRSFPGGLEGSITVHCYITAWKWWQNYITQHSFLQTPSMYSCYDQTVLFFNIWLLLPQYLLPYSLVHLISPQVSLLYFFLIRCNTHLSSPSLSLSVAVVLLCFDGLWSVIVAVHPSIILSVRSERRDRKTQGLLSCALVLGNTWIKCTVFVLKSPSLCLSFVVQVKIINNNSKKLEFGKGCHTYRPFQE